MSRNVIWNVVDKEVLISLIQGFVPQSDNNVYLFTSGELFYYQQFHWRGLHVIGHQNNSALWEKFLLLFSWCGSYIAHFYMEVKSWQEQYIFQWLPALLKVTHSTKTGFLTAKRTLQHAKVSVLHVRLCTRIHVHVSQAINVATTNTRQSNLLSFASTMPFESSSDGLGMDWSHKHTNTIKQNLMQ